MSNVVGIIDSIILILAIFSVLYFLNNDWGVGFTIMLICGALIFIKTYVEKEL